MKLILGIGEPLVGRLLLYDALAMRFRELKLRRNPECPVCGDHPTDHEADRLPGVLRCRRSTSRSPSRRRDGGEIDPTEVKAKIDRGDHFVLIDVREPHEYQICSIPDAKLIPLGELPKRVNELNTADEIVAHCKSGMRSAKAVDFLKQAGFKQRPQHEGRHSRLERQGRPERSEVLSVMIDRTGPVA